MVLLAGTLTSPLSRLTSSSRILRALLIEDLAQGALGQVGETVMPLRRPMFTGMAGEKARRPQFVRIAEFFGLTAGQVFDPGLGFSGDRRCLAGRGRSSSVAIGPSTAARSMQRRTV
jgi:hypothetical protein